MPGIRIGAWPAFVNAQSNPYQSRLYGEIGKDHAVTEISISLRALLEYLKVRFDIVHIHWIERAFWGSRSRGFLKPAILTMAIFCVFYGEEAGQQLRCSEVVVRLLYSLRPDSSAADLFRVTI